MSSEIEVSCPGCNAVFSVPIELSGEVAECSECAAVFEIPKMDEHPDAIDTDTGAVKKGIVSQTADYTSTATNTVKLSRSSIGMIPTLKDSFTFGQKDIGAGFNAPPPQQQPQAPQPSAWGAQPGMPQPRMAPPPPPRPAVPAQAPQQQPRMAPPPPAPVQQQMAPPPPRPAAPAQAPQQQPRMAPPPPAPVQQQMAPPPPRPAAPAQAPAQVQSQKPTFTRPAQPPQPPPARPAQPTQPAPVPSAQAAAPAPASSTQGMAAVQQASIKLPPWTKVQLNQGEEAVAYKELKKNPAVSAALVSVPVIFSAIAVLLNQIVLGLIVVLVLGAVTFIVAFVMSKEGAKRAIILTSQRAICILGKDRIELKK